MGCQMGKSGVQNSGQVLRSDFLRCCSVGKSGSVWQWLALTFFFLVAENVVEVCVWETKMTARFVQVEKFTLRKLSLFSLLNFLNWICSFSFQQKKVQLFPSSDFLKFPREWWNRKFPNLFMIIPKQVRRECVCQYRFRPSTRRHPIISVTDFNDVIKLWRSTSFFLDYLLRKGTRKKLSKTNYLKDFWKKSDILATLSEAVNTSIIILNLGQKHIFWN